MAWRILFLTNFVIRLIEEKDLSLVFELMGIEKDTCNSLKKGLVLYFFSKTSLKYLNYIELNKYICL